MHAEICSVFTDFTAANMMYSGLFLLLIAGITPPMLCGRMSASYIRHQDVQRSFFATTFCTRHRPLQI